MVITIIAPLKHSSISHYFVLAYNICVPEPRFKFNALGQLVQKKKEHFMLILLIITAILQHSQDLSRTTIK